MPDADLDATPDPPRIQSGKYRTEAELAAAASHAVTRRRNADGSRLTQAEIAGLFGVRQTDVSNALRYEPPPADGTPPHLSRRPAAAALRRRILARWGDGGVSMFAGPFWLPLSPDADLDADRFGPGEPADPHPDADPAGLPPDTTRRKRRGEDD